jgi:signal transduction histidine kinase
MLRVRLGAGAALLLGMLLDYHFRWLENPLPLALTACGFLAVTLALRLATLRKPPENVESVQWAGFVQSLVDVAGLTALIFFCGGVENPVLLFYILLVAIVGLVLPTYMTYLVATAAVLSFGGVAVLQATVPSLHHHLPFTFPGQHYENWTFISFVGAVVTLGVYLTAYVTSSIRARLAEADEALQRNLRDMAQREKMVAVGTMAAGVAHEIGNPLACLSAVVQLLRRRNPTDAQREHFENMDELVQRISRIVRQLVEFARPAAAERSVADLDALIEDTLKIMSYSRNGRDIQIVSIRNAQLPPVRLVPQHFQQVILNVTLNALDAVEEVHGDRRRVRVEREQVDGEVQVRVRDWGCGMTADQLRQAFEPFFTTKPPNRGTGLGLAVSYRLVESNGGRIAIASTPDQGTTVTIIFPAEAAAPVEKVM